MVKRDLCRNGHYNTEVDIHEIIEAPYTYEEGKGYVRPEIITMSDRLLAIQTISG